MVHMDVFNQDAFSTVQMTQALETVPYRPRLLGSMGLFDPQPIRTKVASIEERDGTLSLIPTSERGAPLQERTRDRRKVRYVETVRLAEGFTMYADEVQGIREFGSETAVKSLQREMLRMLAGTVDDLELTWEHMRLGAIQGIVVDADGTTPITNWFTEFGVSPPSDVEFSLNDATAEIRLQCSAVRRAMARASGGMFGEGVQITALAGDNFFDKLVTHKSVKETYLNTAAARELRGHTAFEEFTFGGIRWINYRGTDDNSAVAVDTDTAKLFPSGVRGLFQVMYSPAEFDPWVNTPGRDRYVISFPDRDRGAWQRTEVYSYPLFVCRRPSVLRNAVIAT